MEQNIDLEQGQPEFNQDELDSLQVGEKMLEEEQQMLAGKFKDAEALEKAYIELQRKLGSKDEEESAPVEEVRDEEAPAEEVEVSASETLLSSASSEWYENGSLSEDTLTQLQGLSSEELISTYMKMQQAQPQTADLTDAEVSQIKQTVGGESQYDSIMEWSAENLPQEYSDAFNNVVERGNVLEIQMALAGLQQQYELNNGKEGNLRTGKSVVEQADVFRSQAEVIQAMQDPRYDKDPAYRADVFEKLDRSNINF
ncbi:MAG: hypothetical protein VW878_07300 [Candidatus Poseidoniales archaeon]|jgi:hypothetical protein